MVGCAWGVVGNAQAAEKMYIIIGIIDEMAKEICTVEAKHFGLFSGILVKFITMVLFNRLS